MVRIRFYSEDVIFKRVNIWVALLLAGFSESFKNLSAAVLISDRA